MATTTSCLSSQASNVSHPPPKPPKPPQPPPHATAPGGCTLPALASSCSSPCELRVLSWGLNHLGQLGDGTFKSRERPTLALSRLSSCTPPSGMTSPCRQPCGCLRLAATRVRCCAAVTAASHSSGLLFSPSVCAGAHSTTRGPVGDTSSASMPSSSSATCTSSAQTSSGGCPDNSTETLEGHVSAPSWCEAPSPDAPAVMLMQVACCGSGGLRDVGVAPGGDRGGDGVGGRRGGRKGAAREVVLGVHALDERGWWVLRGRVPVPDVCGGLNSSPDHPAVIVVARHCSLERPLPVPSEECGDDGVGRANGRDRDVFAVIAYGVQRDAGEDSMRDENGNAPPNADSLNLGGRGEQGSSARDSAF